MNTKIFNKLKPYKRYLFHSLFLLEAIFIVLILSFVLHVLSLRNVKDAKELTEAQSLALLKIRENANAKFSSASLKASAFESEENAIFLTAGSAILLDAQTGEILYRKNADEEIPPASMTKLVVMYIVFKEIEAGRISYDNIVPLVKESWAKNLPSDSSLMFLAEGQIVTVKELLTGLAVASGNDAAIALAYYISGGVEPFVKRMNEEVRALGLTKTHFVEPSGYDEHNITTAREFAAFCRRYVMDFPDSIRLFHSCRSISYPLKKNLSESQGARYGDSLAVKQKNTNPLLGLLDGVDGLKTGFIYESGYNLALTASRGGRRYISVTMQGGGKGSRQGQANRIKDGTALMELAFSHYDVFFDDTPQSFKIRVLASKTRAANLVCSKPKIALTIPAQEKNQVQKRVSIAPYIFGENKAGAVFGKVEYFLGDTLLETVPLILDRDTKKASALTQAIDRLASHFIK